MTDLTEFVDFSETRATQDRPRKFIYILALLLVITFAHTEGIAALNFTVDQSSLQWAEQNFGSDGRRRLLAWQDFMRHLDKDELVFVEQVNNFFNKLLFVSDAAHWGRNDYWATPTEFIASGGGDCEDFAIAKFFSLVRAGVPSQKLALNFVFASRLNQSHLVLAYYPVPGVEPWVLDNLMDAIKPASQRTDLVPIYSFDASTLWESKQLDKGKQLGHSQRIKPWRELLMRMRKK
ncbi:MAG: transglutaminase-like cysteine peptidase [Desulfobulbus sp.]|nr:transglutaminase-like cysteine peptidase [Desulfobulbus sp.]